MLHKSKLEDFAQWLEARGWKRAKTKGAYEVLRMTWAEETPLIVYRKNVVKEHYTTFGTGQVLVKQWLREKRK